MEAIIISIYNEPHKWKLMEHILVHECGSAIWIANGFFLIKPYPSGHITLWQKIKLWRAYKWWCANAPVTSF